MFSGADISAILVFIIHQTIKKNIKKLKAENKYEKNLFIQIFSKKPETDIIQKLISRAITNGNINIFHINNK